jgi:hypothetical protein
MAYRLYGSKIKSVKKRVTSFTAALVLAATSLSSAAPLFLSQTANALNPVLVNISNVTDLCNAIKNQDNNQTWTINPGTYGLTQCNSIIAGGETGWYFPITANNITINGINNPTIYGKGYVANGALHTQDLIAIFGNDVTLNGLTLMPKVEPNKTIEVMGDGATIKNVTVEPNTLTDQSEYDNIPDAQDRADERYWGGSIYFSGGSGTQTLENVTIKNGGLSDRSPLSTLDLSNVVLSYSTNVDWINAYRYATHGNSVTGAPTVAYSVDSTLNNLDSVLAGAQDGDTVNINSDITASAQINITKALAINGNNHTITAASTIPSNSAVIAPSVANGLTISDLTVNGAGVAKLHGINAFKSTMALNNVTLENNTKNGLVVNSSQVTVNNVTTLNNGWGGIDVDQNNASSAWPAKLTVDGTSHHNEAGPDIKIDDVTKPVSVVDTNSQYNITPYDNARVYKLKPVPPTLTVASPAEGKTVGTVLNGNNLKITGSFTDDVKANYATMQLVYNGNSIAIGTLYGYGSVYNSAATYANADGSYTFNLPVPANLASGEYSLFYTGTDFDGGITSRMERKFTIDNTAPTVNFVSPTPAENDYVHGTITAHVQATDNNGMASYYIRVWKGAFESGSSNLVYNSCSSAPGATALGTSQDITCSVDTSSWSDGTYVMSAQFLDGGSNWGKALRTIHVDNTKPTVPVNGQPYNTSINTNNFYFTWDASSDASLITYEFIASQNPSTSGGVLDTGVWDNITNGVTSEQRNLTSPTIHSTGADDGTWYWQVRAIDAADNKSAWSSVWNVTLDTKTPAIPTAALFDGSSKSITNGYINTEHFTFNLSSSTDVTRYQLKYWNDISKSPFNGLALAWSPTNLNDYMPFFGTYADQFTQGEGTHYFAFSACDAAGNCSEYSTPFTVVYDSTKPVVTVDALSTTDTTPTVRGTLKETNLSGTTLTVQVNGHDYIPTIGLTMNLDGSYPWSVDATDTLPLGTYDVAASATDPAGNVGTDATTNELSVNTSFKRTVTSLAVLGASTTTPNTGNSSSSSTEGSSTDTSTPPPEPAGEVKAAETQRTLTSTDNKSDTTKNSNFLGLGWWWLAVLAALLGFFWLLLGKRAERSEK